MFKNLIWDFGGRMGSQVIGFLVSIILTRILLPNQFGMMAMVMVVIAIATVFVDFGFYKAIVQRNDVSKLQYNSVFYINLMLAGSLATICLFAALPLSRFYNEPQLKPLFRVMSLLFITNGLGLIPMSIIYKQMKFRVLGIFNLSAAVIAGSLAIVAALNGLGVWSLVIQSLVTSLVLLVLYFSYVRWTPSLEFSFKSVKPLWNYGGGIFAIGIIEQVYARIDSFLIGKIFSSSVLGYYGRAQSLDLFVKNMSSSSIISVLFPQIARHQNNRPFIRELYIKYLHVICFISVAVSGSLYLCADEVFTLLFTKKWLYSAELFKLMAVFGFSWPISSLMCNIVAGVGNSKACVRMEVVKMIVVMPVYLFGFLYGLKWFLIFMIAAGIVNIHVNMFFAGKEIELTVADQLKLVASYIFFGAFSCIVVVGLFAFVFTNLHPIISILIKGTVFSLLYLGFCSLTHSSGLHTVTTNIAGLKGKIANRFASV